MHTCTIVLSGHQEEAQQQKIVHQHAPGETILDQATEKGAAGTATTAQTTAATTKRGNVQAQAALQVLLKRLLYPWRHLPVQPRHEERKEEGDLQVLSPGHLRQRRRLWILSW